MARLSSGEVWGEELECFLMDSASSHTLCDFLCMSSCESTNILCRSGRRGKVTGGGFRGVAPVKFIVEPGGEEFGVLLCVMVMGPGEVLRASGDTGVCLR